MSDPLEIEVEPDYNSDSESEEYESDDESDKVIDNKIEPPKEPVELEAKVKENYLLCISNALAEPTLGPLLKKNGFGKRKYEQLSIKELEEQIKQMQQTISQKNTTGLVDMLILGGIQIIETKSTSIESFRSKCDLTGLTTVLRDSKEFKSMLAEIKFMKNISHLLSPEMRIVAFIAYTAVGVAATNAQK